MKKLTRRFLSVFLCFSLLAGFSVSKALFAMESNSYYIYGTALIMFEEQLNHKETYVTKMEPCEDYTFDVYVSDSELAKTKGMRYSRKIKEPYDNSYFKVILTTEGFQVLLMSHYKTSIWIIPDELLGIPVYLTEDTEFCWVCPSKNKKIIAPSRIEYHLDKLIKEKEKGREQLTEVLSYEDYMDYSAFYSGLSDLFV